MGRSLSVVAGLRWHATGMPWLSLAQAQSTRKRQMLQDSTWGSSFPSPYFVVLIAPLEFGFNRISVHLTTARRLPTSATKLNCRNMALYALGSGSVQSGVNFVVSI